MSKTGTSVTETLSELFCATATSAYKTCSYPNRTGIYNFFIYYSNPKSA